MPPESPMSTWQASSQFYVIFAGFLKAVPTGNDTTLQRHILGPDDFTCSFASSKVLQHSCWGSLSVAINGPKRGHPGYMPQQQFYYMLFLAGMFIVLRDEIYFGLWHFSQFEKASVTRFGRLCFVGMLLSPPGAGHHKPKPRSVFFSMWDRQLWRQSS